jgi:hypothetical protein
MLARVYFVMRSAWYYGFFYGYFSNAKGACEAVAKG